MFAVFGRININDGYLEEFALTKKEADDLIMTARDKIYNIKSLPNTIIQSLAAYELHGSRKKN